MIVLDPQVASAVQSTRGRPFVAPFSRFAIYTSACETRYLWIIDIKRRGLWGHSEISGTEGSSSLAIARIRKGSPI